MFKRLSTIVLIIILQPLWAVASPSTNVFLDLKKTAHTDAEWHLAVGQMPLVEVLNNLAKQGGIIIHYSALKKDLVTASCAGSSLHSLLTCLLNNKADFVVRFSRNSKWHNNKVDIADAWVIGPNHEEHTVTCAGCVTPTDKGISEIRREKDKIIEEEKLQAMLKMSSSDNPMERATAMSNLLSIGRDGNTEIKERLEKGLHDQDDNVRTQAVLAFTHRSDIDKEQQLAFIKEAMQDESSVVRLSAVDGITDDIDLLLQAFNDEDELVRSLAQEKYKVLTAQAAQK